MTKAQAIHAFFSRFLPAYEETTVPAGDISAEMPYITYNLVTSSFDLGDTSIDASLWYRSTSWKDINAKTEEISEAISYGGTLLPCDGGYIWLKRGNPFAQNMGDDADNMIRRKLLNVTAEYLTK